MSWNKYAGNFQDSPLIVCHVLKSQIVVSDMHMQMLISRQQSSRLFALRVTNTFSV